MDRGEQLDEGALLRALRSPHCPADMVEQLAANRRVLSLVRVLPVLLSHPKCPRHFALDAIPRLGWRDLITVANRPQTPSAIRRHAERRVVERLPQLTLGERRSLARLAPGLVRSALLRDRDPRCIAALLDNPKMTETEVVRLLATNESSECLSLALRHPRWGASAAVRHAALRSRRVSRATVLGLLATLSEPELARLAQSTDVPSELRRTAAALVAHRKLRHVRQENSGPPCDPRSTT